MADFGGASQAEMEGWVAEERVYGELRGAAQPGGTLCRGLVHWFPVVCTVLDLVLYAPTVMR